MQNRATTNTILMVRPASFGYNAETGVNNVHQTQVDASDDEVANKAIAEFDGMVQLLRSKGVEVIVLQDDAQPEKPDAIFPNNWVTFEHDGQVCLFPMFAENRRIERRPEALKPLLSNFIITDWKDLYSDAEANDIYLEGTGSIVIDHPNKIMYACLSERTNKQLFEAYADLRGYKAVAFTAVETDGSLIYHTNVLMCMGTDIVVICLDAIQNEDEEELLLDLFQQTNKKVIAISHEQMNQYAGNMLEVRGADNQPYLVMSRSACKSLIAGQIKAIEAHVEILVVDIDTIETVGGGSARCMMAEVFLPRA